MTRTGIFISYRRDDSSGHAGRLYDRLSVRFGEDRVFMDIDAIDPGVDFTEAIDQAVSSCAVLVALIGQEWLTASDKQGRRRLDNPKDFVRQEIAHALKAPDVRVVPVLVQGATMPGPDQLPDDLTALARRNAIELSDERWQYDVGRLIETIEQVMAASRVVASAGEPAPQPIPAPQPSPRPTPPDRATVARRQIAPGALAGIAVGLVAVIVATFFVLRPDDDDNRPTGATVSVDAEGVIAFISDKSGACEIHLVNADGDEERQLTHNGSANLRPDWSADGEQLAYASNQGGGYDIYVVDVSDGTETKLLDHPGEERGPDWSHDDEQMVFSSIFEGHSEIWLLDVGAEDAVQITEDNAHNVSPDWSPEGDLIAYTSNVDGNFDIWVMNPEGGERDNLTGELFGESSREFDPQWSPDGSELTFEAQPMPGDDYDIWAIDREGTTRRNVTAHSDNDRHSSWSPDGNTIVFGSDRLVPEDDTETGCATDELQRDLFLMNSDGTEQQRLTRIEADDSAPAWSPAP